MMDVQQRNRIYEAARRELGKLPGVVDVCLGHKRVKGELSAELALIVVVEKKLEPDQLRSDEIVPREFHGLRTDVQNYIQGIEYGSPDLVGGLQLRRNHFIELYDKPPPGTLGYIATKISDQSSVILSCEHILDYNGGAQFVYHPQASDCCGRLKNRVGKAIAGTKGNVSFNGNNYWVDAAIASLQSGVTSHRHIPLPNDEQIRGSGSLINYVSPGPHAPLLEMKKKGARTDYTKGEMMALFWVDPDPTPPNPERLFQIRPLAGEGRQLTFTLRVPSSDVLGYVNEFTDAFNETGLGNVTSDGNVIIINVEVFSAPGDSGSVVIDDSGDIVGLIVRGSGINVEAYNDKGRLEKIKVPTGYTYASHIAPVLDQLGIRIDPSTVPAAGRSVVVPGNEISVHRADQLPELNARIAELQRELEESHNGRRLMQFVRDYAGEMMDLVHHRRRVLVTWHRNHGPTFVALFLRAIMEPDSELPRSAKGKQLERIRERMYEVLVEEGSPELRRALIANKSLIYDLMDKSGSIRDLVRRAKQNETAEEHHVGGAP